MTVIKRCSCKHEWQDKRYGAGKRLMNALKKGTGPQEYRCTVCTNVRQ